MVDLRKNESGQLMLLTGLLIILQVIVYTTLLNNLIFTNNMPSSGLDMSKRDIREIRLLTETDIRNAANYANTSVSDPTNQTLVENYFISYVNNFSQTINKMYSNRGASVEILLNNVTFNITTSSLVENKYFIERKQTTFSIGSLIIPMDGNQTNRIKVYGLIYKIVDDSNSSGLDSIRIPVYELLQNPVNSTVPDFYSTIFTDDNASTASGLIEYRKYSGGPFIIDNSSIDEISRGMILAEAAIKNITVHELKEAYSYNFTVKMVVPPRVSFFASSNVELMQQYYNDSDVPVTQLSKAEILAGNLTDFDILTIPHENMDASQFSSMISPIVGWVANGGVIHIECSGTDTMDDAVESDPVAGPAKPWYGFIGVTRSVELPNGTSIPYPGIKLLDNSTLSYNNSPPMPLSGLSDLGAPYNPLTQSSIENGTFGTTGGTTKAFSLRDSGQVNPGTNILGYAVDSSGVVLNGDYDKDGTSEPQLMYLEATYDNGLVIYIAGHNLTERNPSAEGLIFESFFAASMRNQEVTTVTAKNINVSIKYSDGKVKYSDTFLVNI